MKCLLSSLREDQQDRKINEESQKSTKKKMKKKSNKNEKEEKTYDVSISKMLTFFMFQYSYLCFSVSTQISEQSR